MERWRDFNKIDLRQLMSENKGPENIPRCSTT